MQTVTVREAQSHLAEIIDKLPLEGEIVITRDDKPVATLRVASPNRSRTQRQLGTLKGSVLYMAPDFDAIPEGVRGVRRVMLSIDTHTPIRQLRSPPPVVMKSRILRFYFRVPPLRLDALRSLKLGWQGKDACRRGIDAAYPTGTPCDDVSAQTRSP